jgi:hypothetical protein
MTEMNYDSEKRIYREWLTGRVPLDREKQLRDMGSRGARLVFCTAYGILFANFVFMDFLHRMPSQTTPRLSLGLHERSNTHVNRCWNKLRYFISSNLQSFL